MNIETLEKVTNAKTTARSSGRVGRYTLAPAYIYFLHPPRNGGVGRPLTRINLDENEG